MIDRARKVIYFILSPVISMPVVLIEIYNKKKLGLVLTSFFFGFISYLYVPSISNDKARYFERFSDYVNYSHAGFYDQIISKRPDFIFEYLIYLFSSAGITIQFLFFIITSSTVGILLWVFDKTVNKYQISKKEYFLCFILVICSFSLPDLLSGIRFYFSISLILLAFYCRLVLKKKIVSLIYLTASVGVHFSTALFVPLYFTLSNFPSWHRLYRFLFFASFICLFIPKSFLIGILNPIVPAVYLQKFEAYLVGQDFIQNALQTGSDARYFVYQSSIAWSYFAYSYLAVSFQKKSIYRNVVYLSFAVVNIFYVVPTVYSRYLIIVLLFFVLLLLYEYDWRRRYPIYIMMAFSVLYFLTSIYIMRYNFSASLLNVYSLSTFTAVFRNINPSDFLN